MKEGLACLLESSLPFTTGISISTIHKVVLGHQRKEVRVFTMRKDRGVSRCASIQYITLLPNLWRKQWLGFEDALHEGVPEDSRRVTLLRDLYEVAPARIHLAQVGFSPGKLLGPVGSSTEPRHKLLEREEVLLPVRLSTVRTVHDDSDVAAVATVARREHDVVSLDEPNFDGEVHSEATLGDHLLQSNQSSLDRLDDR